MSLQEQVAQIALTLSESDARFLLDFLRRIAPQNTNQVMSGGRRTPLDFESYGRATERGRYVERYMEEIRGNDRV